jgi:CelD/BcsL family acetyltransferase involved in cellulose biosynthesis
VASLESELVEANQGLLDLRSDWRKLHAASTTATLSNSWEWVSTWWDVYRQDNWALYLVLFRERGKLVGIAPLYRKHKWLHSELWLLGCGEDESDEVVSEYSDLLVCPEYSSDIGQEAWAHLEKLGRWSFLKLENVFPHSLVAELKSGLRLTRPAGVRYRLPLSENRAEFLADRGSNMRRKFAQASTDGERAAASEQVSRDWNGGGERAFDQLATLHNKRWRSKGQSGVFESALFCRFHKQLFVRYATDIGCEFRIICIDGEPLSALYNFSFGDTVYFYQSGFAEHSQVRSPGLLAHGLAIDEAISGNKAFYDLMRGDIDSYKVRFRCEVTDMCNITHYRKDVSSALFFLKDYLKSIVRKVLA